MFLSMKHVILLALVVAFSEASLVVTDTGTVTLSIVNYLQGGLELTVNCQTKDGSLGLHVIPIYGRYQWQFNPFVLKSKIECRLVMRDGAITYILYSYERDNERCSTECLWDVQTDGVLSVRNS
ncbi:putative plant self-incompatibility S1 [Lupinus albus]|uniref:Putative plant self-incompatibility S1 n=1 Tax=Lupinus albus TaxID=3870 RepID=A0A6A4P2V1_LUPAL|nr:putative plant self-incompatibility S1 [Lupinus albus]